MSDSIERVEQWGKALAELSEMEEKRQIEIAKEEAKVVPSYFSELEKIAMLITPHDVILKIRPLLPCSTIANTVLISLELDDYNLYNPRAIYKKAFQLNDHEFDEFWNGSYIHVSDSLKIILPELRALFQELQCMKLMPDLTLGRRSVFLLIHCTEEFRKMLN